LRYEGLDISLGPEMKSTGEVMGRTSISVSRMRIANGRAAALPKTGKVFISVKDTDKERSSGRA